MAGAGHQCRAVRGDDAAELGDRPPHRGSIWCGRKIEISLAVWGSVEIFSSPPRVVWTLPTSKTDPQVLVEGKRSVRDRLAALEAQRGERDCTGVVRTTFGPARAKGLVWHRPLQTEWRRLPSQSWRTICGWQFGSGQFEWLEAPQGGKACEKCFFEEVPV